jgi:hypothetical protein
MAKDPTPDSPQLSEYQAARAAFAARLAVPDGAANAPSVALRSSASLILAQADALAGLTPATHEQQQQAASYPGGFEGLVRDTAQLAGVEWQSSVLPSELLRLANAVASA